MSSRSTRPGQTIDRPDKSKTDLTTGQALDEGGRSVPLRDNLPGACRDRKDETSTDLLAERSRAAKIAHKLISGYKAQGRLGRSLVGSKISPD